MFEICFRSIIALVELLTRLRFTIRPEKSQRIIFLGLVIESVKITVILIDKFGN